MNNSLQNSNSQQGGVSFTQHLLNSRKYIKDIRLNIFSNIYIYNKADYANYVSLRLSVYNYDNVHVVL